MIEGFVVASLAEGYESFEGSKMRLESAFNFAWQGWHGTFHYPSIDPSDFLGKASRSERRTGVLGYATWQGTLNMHLSEGIAWRDASDVLEQISERSGPDETQWRDLTRKFSSELA